MATILAFPPCVPSQHDPAEDNVCVHLTALSDGIVPLGHAIRTSSISEEAKAELLSRLVRVAREVLSVTSAYVAEPRVAGPSRP